MIAGVTVGGGGEVWRRFGFGVVDDAIRLDGVVLDVTSGRPLGLTLAGESDGEPGVTDLDGLPLSWGDPAPPGDRHDNGAVGLDHVVVTTPSLDRTTAALDALGLEVRRERAAGAIRQRFLRLGAVILEMVGPADEPDPVPGVGEQPATIWGLAFTAPDLATVVGHAAAAGLPMGDPRPAVQPGRHIVSVKREAGLPLPVAFMTP